MRHHSYLLITFLIAAIVGGVALPIDTADGLTGPVEFVSANDETRYAEAPPAPDLSAPSVASSAAKLKLPILVYHIVRPSFPSDSQAVKNIAQTPEVFDAQMQYLSDAGYHVVSFGDLENHYRSEAALPDKPIIISFDDGWSNQFHYAFPLLKKHRYTAAFFVFTNPIGSNKNFITWDELREMRDAGMTIGSHSRSHPYLTTLSDPTKLWNEIAGSKERLEKELGVPVTEFAYPFGQYNPSIVAMVEKSGYKSARGDRYYRGEQTASRLFDLDAMNAPTDLPAFKQKFP
ncbi:MAG: polysaccharide deacetylase family protein [Candidatus Pacebacteria bacterium]|nr:polysaccharide deacetylase family protein [Candidatus Paceibacterota bacterium]